MELKKYGIEQIRIEYLVKDYTMCSTPDKSGTLVLHAEDDANAVFEKCPNGECESDGFRLSQIITGIAHSRDTYYDGMLICDGKESRKQASLGCPCRVYVKMWVTYVDAVL